MSAPRKRDPNGIAGRHDARQVFLLFLDGVRILDADAEFEAVAPHPDELLRVLGPEGLEVHA
jgi:hypothetical protein